MIIQKLHGCNSSISINRAIELLDISKSSYYNWLKNVNRKQKKLQEENKFVEIIKDIIKEFPGYGYRRITIELKNRGFNVNHKRVLRLMKQNNLIVRKKRYKPITTNSNHDNRIYPNLIKEISITHPNQVWVSDITYIQLKEEFVYLATILDVYTRKCIGWNLSRNLDTELALVPLKSAIKARWNPDMDDIIHHSDRGVQYTSKKYTTFLEEHNIRISMSRKANPYDNAYAESFFKTLKYEEVYLNEYMNMEEVWHNIHRFIEEVYNLKRLHSSLGYKSPIDFEREVNLNSIA